MRTPDRIAFVNVAFLTAIALAVRLAVPLVSGFPLNDGGLFYTMIADLLSNGFRLPEFTTYNAASIPFAYPPLALYSYSIMSVVSRVSVLDLMQYGPAVVSAASIPPFYFLAKDVLDSKTQAVVATLVFSLVPRAFDWLIMGGGVTRSLGLFFALLAMREAFKLFSSRSPARIVPMIVLGSLVVYTHPEAAVHTAVTAAVFYLWKDRSSGGLLRGGIASLGIIALTSPWWGTVLARFGPDPFLAAGAAARQDSYNWIMRLVALFRFDFADEPYVTVFTVLGLLGLMVQMAKHRYLLPAWLVASYVLEPRGGTLFMVIPLSLGAALSLTEMVLPPLGLASPRGTPHMGPIIDSGGLEQLLKASAVRAFLACVFVYGTVSAYETAWKIGQELTLSSADLQALAWVRKNTGAQSRFAVVTQGLPLQDATSDWFPAITGRQSVATVFGYEWLRRADFGTRIDRYRSLQACADSGPDCLRRWSEKNHVVADYVYIRNPLSVAHVPLAVFLNNSPNYGAVYDSPTVVIFQQKCR